MYLTGLSLQNFKNYHATYFEFSPELNFFTGENGAGKTNVLDAIHYLCLGKSYFHGNDYQAIRHGESYHRVHGNFLSDNENFDIACVYQTGSKKELQKNNIAYSRMADHVGLIPVVMVTPDDHYLIDEGSEERRRFMDYTLSQTDHNYLENLVNYNRVLQQRNALLKQCGSRTFPDPSLIETFNDQLITFGEKIFKVRESFHKKIKPLIEKYYSIISGQSEEIFSKYISVFHLENFRSALIRSAEKDRMLQRTTEGVHRDDFEFYMDEKLIKKFASQGQKKSFLMALKIAQFELLKKETNKTPILLLDDLFDKLDEQRTNNILDLLKGERFKQVFVTDTNFSRVQEYISITKKQFKVFELQKSVRIMNAEPAFTGQEPNNNPD
ncbi:MAG: DNA replication and repair protein RecF [Chitinophagales bacterium]|nr:DNA replication and repair protein RecF [Chitinophagales bacterium]